MESKHILKTKALAWLQMQEKEVLHTGELQNVLNISAKQEANLLAYLKKSGLIVQLMRGVSLVPLKLPPDNWLPTPYKIIFFLMKELNAKYQIAGLYAFNHYGLSSQVPIGMSVYNTKLSGKRVVGGVNFEFIRVTENRIGGINDISLFCEKLHKIQISSLARTLLDAVYDYKRFATLPDAYAWITHFKNDQDILKDLVKMTIQYGNVGTKRRVGFILSAMNVNVKLRATLYESIPKSKSVIPLIPGASEKGAINKKWGIIINGPY